jgi:hypothetical protein
VNPPDGDTEDSPGELSKEQIEAWMEGAELLRFTPGTEEHAGNVMAVFETPNAPYLGIGITFDNSSSYPNDLTGMRFGGLVIEEPELRMQFHDIPDNLPKRESDRTVQLESGYRVTGGDAAIYLDGHGERQIAIRNTDSLGIYEVEPEQGDS